MKTDEHAILIRMIIVSTFLHAALIITLIKYKPFPVARIEMPNIKSIRGYLIPKDMLHKMSMEGVKKKEHALPPPIIKPKLELSKEPKSVHLKKVETELERKKVLKKLQNDLEKKKKKDEEKRIKALEALLEEDDRKAPRKDNFPKQDNNKEKGPEIGTGGQNIPQSEFEAAMNYYQVLLSEIIKTNWNIPSKKFVKNFLTKNSDASISVRVTINSKGEILTFDIIKKTGVELIDRSFINAIKKVDKFPLPPEEIRKSVLENKLLFTFDRDKILEYIETSN